MASSASIDPRAGLIEPRYMGLDAAATYLGVTPKALRHYVHRRTVPFSRIGRRLLFDRQALDRWIARRSLQVARYDAEHSGGEPMRPRKIDGCSDKPR